MPPEIQVRDGAVAIDSASRFKAYDETREKAKLASANEASLTAIVGFNDLPLLAKAIDSEADDVAFAKIDWRLLAQPYARRSARGNDISRLQTHEPAEITDKGCNAEDHSRRGAVLIAATVYFQPKTKVLGIGYLVSSNKIWTDWAECICAFTFHPLPCAFKLKGAF